MEVTSSKIQFQKRLTTHLCTLNLNTDPWDLRSERTVVARRVRRGKPRPRKARRRGIGVPRRIQTPPPHSAADPRRRAERGGLLRAFPLPAEWVRAHRLVELGLVCPFLRARERKKEKLRKKMSEFE